MIKARAGKELDRWIERLFPFLFLRPLNPNLLTVIGALVSVGAAAALADGRLVAGGWLIALGGFFDLVDGVVARHGRTSTRFGAFLDSTLDRFVDMVILIGIMLHYARTGDLGLVLLAGVVLVLSVLTSYSKARAETVIDEVRGGIFERAERVVVLALGAVTGFLPLALWIVAIGAGVTTVQRVSSIHRELARLDASEPQGEHS